MTDQVSVFDLFRSVRSNRQVSITLLIVVGGFGVGVLYGLFGVGSAFATPVLALIGVPAMAAVVGPLPSLLPSSAVGAWSYSKAGKVDWRIARLALLGAFPAALIGAGCSRWVGGPVLLTASGVVLLVVGLRVIRPGAAVAPDVAARRCADATFIISAAAAIGFASGLLANGGGFLLVPLFLVALGFDMNDATGTSLVVAAALTVPTIAMHALRSDIDWSIAALFALGMLPGVLAGSRVAPLVPTERLSRAFGFVLLGFAAWFVLRQFRA